MSDQESQVGLTRQQYDELYQGPNAPEYPKCHKWAAIELMSRGYDCTAQHLEHLTQSGQVPRDPSLSWRRPGWTKERIDQAATLLEKNGRWMGEAYVGAFFNIPLYDIVKARRAFEASNPSSNAYTSVWELSGGCEAGWGGVRIRTRRPEKKPWYKRLAAVIADWFNHLER